MAFTEPDTGGDVPEGPTPPEQSDSPTVTGPPEVPYHPLPKLPPDRPPNFQPTKFKPHAPARVDSARVLLEDFLNQFGLGGIADWAWKTYKQAGGGDLGLKMVQAEMHTQPAFKARFPAYEAMAKAGKAMSPADMLAYEKMARETMRAAGLPPGFYDKPDDFAKFMMNDVSANELQDRVQMAQQAVIETAPDVRAQLQNLYGVHAGDLTAYFLDPKAAVPLLHQKFTSAQIAAAGTETAFGQINAAQAEGLTQLGVTADAARTGFGTLAANAGLFQDQVAGEAKIGTDEQLSAQFSNDQAAQLRIKRRQQARVADFSGSSGTSIGKTGIGALDPGSNG